MRAKKALSLYHIFINLDKTQFYLLIFNNHLKLAISLQNCGPQNHFLKQGLRVGVGSQCIFGGKESGVGKVRESESGVGNIKNMSQRRSRESGVRGFLG